MQRFSYYTIVLSLFSMVIASALLYFELAGTAAFVMLVGGFFGIGIGLLTGFFALMSGSENQ